jgi:hypothetical protein
MGMETKNIKSKLTFRVIYVSTFLGYGVRVVEFSNFYSINYIHIEKGEHLFSF